MTTRDIPRRRYLATGALSALGLFSGCLRLEESEGGDTAETEPNDDTAETEPNDDRTTAETEPNDDRTTADNESDPDQVGPEAYWNAIERSREHFDRASTVIDAAFEHMENDEWDSCVTRLEDAPEEIVAAHETGRDAFEMAEADGPTEYETAAEEWLELITMTRRNAIELEALCEAGVAGDEEEIRERRERIQLIGDELEEQERVVEEAFERIENG